MLRYLCTRTTSHTLLPFEYNLFLASNHVRRLADDGDRYSCLKQIIRHLVVIYSVDRHLPIRSVLARQRVHTSGCSSSPQEPQKLVPSSDPAWSKIDDVVAASTEAHPWAWISVSRDSGYGHSNQRPPELCARPVQIPACFQQTAWLRASCTI